MKKNIKETEFAWLAGFMDGDGCFTCAVHERKLKSGIPSIVIEPRLTATQTLTKRDVIDRISDLTGIGKTYVSTPKSEILNSKPKAQWITGNLQDIKDLCEKLLPYMYNKKKECEIMLEIVTERLKSKQDINRKRRERTPLSNTLKCAKLGLSLNIDSSSNRNKRKNNYKNTWNYFKIRIPEIYKEADYIISTNSKNKYVTLICTTCGIKFDRLKCNIKEGTKNNFCSMSCKDNNKGK